MKKKLDSSSVLITIVAERFVADGKTALFKNKAAGLEISYVLKKKKKGNKNSNSHRN